MIALLAVPFVAHSATVELAETSSPPGLIDRTTFIESATVATTSAAPLTGNGQRFTHWTIAGTRAQDFIGRAVNPASFTIYEDISAVAHYLPEDQDGDGDLIPDWYEIEFYGDLTLNATSDSDADGFDLVNESVRDYHPRLHDSIAAGGVSRRRSTSVAIILLSDHIRLHERSEPPGILSVSRVIEKGVPAQLSEAPQTSHGHVFVGWFVNDVRVDSPTAVKPFFLTANVDTTAVARYVDELADTDADDVLDWREMFYYGTLDHDTDYDGDGDGFPFADELQRGYHPLVADAIAEGGISRRRSMAFDLNLAGFYDLDLNSSPEGLLSEVITVPDGTVATSPDLGGDERNGQQFTHWTLDGIRQEDTVGAAAGSFSVAMDADHQGIAYYLPEDLDADDDGVLDWMELHYYGDTSTGSGEDTEGDGFDLLDEVLRAMHPLLIDRIVEGGISRRRSAGLTAVNLELFERLRYLLVHGVLSDFFADPLSGSGGRTWNGATSPAAGDWDGDGDFDLFIADADGLTPFENRGDAATPDLRRRGGLASISADVLGRNGVSLAAGDWNGDDLVDLATGADEGEVHFFASDGSFSASNGLAFSLPVAGGPVAPSFAEVTGDDRVDLLVLLPDGRVRLYENDGGAQPFDAGSFTEDWLGHTVPAAVGLAVADFTRDGVQDVLVSNAEGRIYEFHGSAGGGFFQKSKVWGGTGRGFAEGMRIAAFDFDNDSDTDLLGGTAGGLLLGLRDPRIGAPSGLRAAAGADTVLLTWEPNPQSRVRGYHVYRSTDPVTGWERLTTEPLTGNHFRDTWAVRANVYYRVTAVSESFLPGNSEPREWESDPSDIALVEGGVVTLTLRAGGGRPGRLVRVGVSVDNSFGLSGAGLQLRLAYPHGLLVPTDQTPLKADAVKLSQLTPDLVIAHNAETASGELAIDGSSGEFSPGAGTVFRLNFYVAEGQTAGTLLPITFNSASIHDTHGTPLETRLVDGEVEIDGSFRPGDVNGDATVDSADRIALIAYLQPGAPRPTTNRLHAGDLNGDGVLSVHDLILLDQLLAGEDI